MAVISVGAFFFQPRLWTTVAALFGVVLTLLLGQWQIGRAEYKEGLQMRQDDLGRESVVQIGAAVLPVDDVLLRKVEVRGVYVSKHTVYIDNRIFQHQPGYHVVTPLRIADSQRHVLVNRGWMPANRDRSLPVVDTPVGEQRVQGVAVAYSERYLELSTKVAEGNVWQNLVHERYRQATGLDLQPFVIQQTSGAEDGLNGCAGRDGSIRNSEGRGPAREFRATRASLLR